MDSLWGEVTEERGIVPRVETRRELGIRMLRVATFLFRPSSCFVCCVLVFRSDLLMCEVRLVSKVLPSETLRVSGCFVVTVAPEGWEDLREGGLPGATGATRAGRRLEARAAVLGSE